MALLFKELLDTLDGDITELNGDYCCKLAQVMGIGFDCVVRNNEALIMDSLCPLRTHGAEDPLPLGTFGSDLSLTFEFPWEVPTSYCISSQQKVEFLLRPLPTTQQEGVLNDVRSNAFAGRKLSSLC
jgi:hypothetical protein